MSDFSTVLATLGKPFLRLLSDQSLTLPLMMACWRARPRTRERRVFRSLRDGLGAV
jgi:hypothetical protein